MKKNNIKNILVISLSNIGDIILTTPVIKNIETDLPGRNIDVMVAPAGKHVFEGFPGVRRVFIYDKKTSWKDKFKLFISLRARRYDLIVDLRNTVLPFVLLPKYRTSSIGRSSKDVSHRIDLHLSRLKKIGLGTSERVPYVPVGKEDRGYIENILERLGIRDFIVMSPGAKSHVKRWPIKNFAKLADMIKEELGLEVILAGDKNDAIVIERILFHAKSKPVSLLGLTNIRELAYLIQKSKLLVTNDSAPLHVGGAVGANILVFFGPTDHKKYGPAGSGSAKVLRRELACSPCETAQCVNAGNKYECLKTITPEEAFQSVRELLKL